MNPQACSEAMAKTNLSQENRQKVLSGAPDAELHTYNQALPLMMVRYMGPGLLGLGITALIAGFMSGMAGNVSAFSTVWTYDIYRPLINKKASDSHYVLVGRLFDRHRRDCIYWRRVPGTAVPRHHGLRSGSLQRLRGAPVGDDSVWYVLEARHGASRFPWLVLWHHFLGEPVHVGQADSLALATVALSPDAKPMAENVFRALWAFIFTAIIVFVVSMMTKARPEKELDGLVYGATVLPKEEPVPFYKNEYTWAVLVVVIFAILNIMFW